MIEKIHFEKAHIQHESIIFSWLAEPHMIEFWDNTQEHKDDILNFIHGRKQNYFYGSTKYWIGYFANQPFALLLSDEILPTQKMSALQRNHLSNTGKTITLDFGIGNIDFLGKGLAAPTLIKFVDFYHRNIDPSANTFFIDPNINNPRAFHVYEKAGFEMVGYYKATEGAFTEQESCLLVKKL